MFKKIFIKFDFINTRGRKKSSAEPEPLSHLPFFGGMKMGLCVLIGKDQRFLDLSEITIFNMLCV